LTFDSGRGYFHNDIIEQGTLGRHVRIVGESGTIEWHQNQPAVRLYNGSRKQNEYRAFDRAADWKEALEASHRVRELVRKRKGALGAVPSGTEQDFSYESCYFREMAHFVAAVRERSTFAVTSREEFHTLRVFDAIRESNRKHAEINVHESPRPET